MVTGRARFVLAARAARRGRRWLRDRFAAARARRVRFTVRRRAGAGRFARFPFLPVAVFAAFLRVLFFAMALID
jgi:hypothetical protein